MNEANTQEMEVTVTFKYNAEVFEGDDDMYEVAEQEQRFFANDLGNVLQDYEPTEGPTVSVKPILTN